MASAASADPSGHLSMARSRSQTYVRLVASAASAQRRLQTHSGAWSDLAELMGAWKKTSQDKIGFENLLRKLNGNPSQKSGRFSLRSCKADKAGFQLSRTFASQSVTFSVCRPRWSLRRPLPCRKLFTESLETCCERREAVGAHTDPQWRPESSRSDGSAGQNPRRVKNAF